MTEDHIVSESQPLASVVVVTLNGIDILRQCLLSLLKQDYPCFEIIVVDNGSHEDIRGMIQKDFSGVSLVRLERNAGFAGGTNAGIKIAKGKYVALINNDAAASPAWLSSMVRAVEADAKIGAVGSLVVDGNNPTVLDSCGVRIALDGMSRQAMIGCAVPKFSSPMEVLAVSGCACLFRLSALEQTGLFDERFFAYCEDTDLCLRLQRMGWRIVVAPDAKVMHYYSQTAGSFSLNKIFWLERNHFWVAFKNFPLILLPAVPLVSLWRCVVLLYAALRRLGPIRAVISDQGVVSLAFTILAAQIASLAGLPGIICSRMAARVRTRQPSRLSGIEMCRLIFRFRLSVYGIMAGASSSHD
jgi:GT2 family glycosyltransferase